MKTHRRITCALILPLFLFVISSLGCRHLPVPIALYGYPTHPQAEAAVARLLSSDPVLVREAHKELSILSEGAMPELAEAMRSADSEGRAKILEVACGIGAPGLLLADIFNSGSQDSWASLRKAVAFRAGQYSSFSSRIGPVLRGLTTDAEPEVRAAALSSLAAFPIEEHPDPRSLGLLIDDSSVLVAASAISISINRPEPELQSNARSALPRLITGLKDSDPATRAAVLSAIGHFGVMATPAVPGLKKVMEHDKVPEVRLQAAIALLRVNTPVAKKAAIPALKRFLRDPDPRLRAAAQSALNTLSSR